MRILLEPVSSLISRWALVHRFSHEPDANAIRLMNVKPLLASTAVLATLVTNLAATEVLLRDDFNSPDGTYASSDYWRVGGQAATAPRALATQSNQLAGFDSTNWAQVYLITKDQFYPTLGHPVTITGELQWPANDGETKAHVARFYAATEHRGDTPYYGANGAWAPNGKQIHNSFRFNVSKRILSSNTYNNNYHPPALRGEGYQQKVDDPDTHRRWQFKIVWSARDGKPGTITWTYADANAPECKVEIPAYELPKTYGGHFALWATKGTTLDWIQIEGPRAGVKEGAKTTSPAKKRTAALPIPSREAPIIDKSHPLYDRPLHVTALCDFIDDVHHTAVTKKHVGNLMRLLRESGVQTVSWAYYADDQGGHLSYAPRKDGQGWDAYRRLGNPMRIAAKAARKEGLDIYGYFKPYEMAISSWIPEGAPEAKTAFFNVAGGRITNGNPFVIANPQYCIQHKNATRPPKNLNSPVATIKLFSVDDKPTDIKKEHIEIWVSPNNYKYKKLDVPFDLKESLTEADHDIVSFMGKPLVAKGDPIRTLTLTGWDLHHKYIVLRADSGKPSSTFQNIGTELLRMYDAAGDEIEGVFANSMTIYHPRKQNFRDWGLIFDNGYGIRMGGFGSRSAYIAWKRGRTKHLGAPCESEPAVQEYWLKCIEAMLDAGCTGIELRIENHSTHTDYPHEYGYNQVVLDALPDPKNPTPEQIAKARGDFYTAFVRRAHELVKSRGAKLRMNFEIGVILGYIPQYRKFAFPMNVDIQWKRWIEEGIIDEAVIRFLGIGVQHVLNSPNVNTLLDMCDQRKMPVHFNWYIIGPQDQMQVINRVKLKEKFTGFIFYEVAGYVEYLEDDQVQFKYESLPEAIKHARGKAK